MYFRWISGGSQIFLGGFLGVFRGISDEISDGFLSSYQIVFRRFSIPLNQILFRMYSEHKNPIVIYWWLNHCIETCNLAHFAEIHTSSSPLKDSCLGNRSSSSPRPTLPMFSMGQSTYWVRDIKLIFSAGLVPWWQCDMLPSGPAGSVHCGNTSLSVRNSGLSLLLLTWCTRRRSARGRWVMVGGCGYGWVCVGVGVCLCVCVCVWYVLSSLSITSFKVHWLPSQVLWFTRHYQH